MSHLLHTIKPRVHSQLVSGQFWRDHSERILIMTIMGDIRYEPVHEISNNLVCATNKASDQPAHTRSLIRAFASRLSIL